MMIRARLEEGSTIVHIKREDDPKSLCGRSPWPGDWHASDNSLPICVGCASKLR